MLNTGSSSHLNSGVEMLNAAPALYTGTVWLVSLVVSVDFTYDVTKKTQVICCIS